MTASDLSQKIRRAIFKNLRSIGEVWKTKDGLVSDDSRPTKYFAKITIYWSRKVQKQKDGK